MKEIALPALIPSRLAVLAAAALVAASACMPIDSPAPRLEAPPSRPTALDAAASPTMTAKSSAARSYYAQVQQTLLSQQLLRTDGGGDDAPFDDRILARNFTRIALYDEYSRSGGTFVRNETASVLRKWVAPVRVGLRFGASVPADRQATDRARVGSYLARLSQLTGHPIALSDASPNFWVHIVSEDEREAMGPTLASQLPGLSASDIADVTNMPRNTYCLVYALSGSNPGVYTRAVAVIRAEHPDLLRLSCIHEEIAQGLGLPNDSPQARPSIFNDDEEYALLTRQDEMMLRLLYNPALRPGMTVEEARPIVEKLAAKMMGGPS